MESTKEKNRICKFDNLKFFLIFLVVLGHVIDPFVNNDEVYKSIFIFIYSFHMPLFVFLVGLFQKKISSFKELPLKKIGWYIFLVYFMKIITQFVAIHFDVKWSFSIFGGSSHYWFLWVMAIYIMVTPLIGKVKFSFLLVFSIILAAFCGYDSSVGDNFQLSRIVIFFPFYLIGYHLNDKKDKLMELSNNAVIRIVSFVMLILFVYICVEHLDMIYPLRKMFTARHPFSSISAITCTYNTRITTYLISALVGFCVLSLTPNIKIPVISKCGARTLQVYVLHRSIIIMLSGMGVFNTIVKSYPTTAPIILTIISLLMSLVLSFGFIEKAFNFVRDSIFKTTTA